MTEPNLLQDWEPGHSTFQPKPSPSRRILVVDGDPGIREIYTQMLIYFGYEVYSAEDGAEAWETLQTSGYDLLITDNSMQRLGGIGLIKRLHNANLSLPVILVAGLMPTEELETHSWLRIEAVLLKPFTAGELLAAVRKALDLVGSSPGQLQQLPQWLWEWMSSIQIVHHPNRRH